MSFLLPYSKHYPSLSTRLLSFSAPYPSLSSWLLVYCLEKNYLLLSFLLLPQSTSNFFVIMIPTTQYTPSFLLSWLLLCCKLHSSLPVLILPYRTHYPFLTTVLHLRAYTILPYHPDSSCTIIPYTLSFYTILTYSKISYSINNLSLPSLLILYYHTVYAIFPFHPNSDHATFTVHPILCFHPYSYNEVQIILLFRSDSCLTLIMYTPTFTSVMSHTFKVHTIPSYHGDSYF